jgi:hypothetical protein
MFQGNNTQETALGLFAAHPCNISLHHESGIIQHVYSRSMWLASKVFLKMMRSHGTKKINHRGHREKELGKRILKTNGMRAQREAGK